MRLSSLLLLAFGVIGTAVLIWLGVWQLQRLEWKEGILSEIESRIVADPVALPAQIEPERDKYLPVRVTGTVTGGELHVLVSRKQVGPGYRIISRFVTEAGRSVLLDRGFVKIDQKNASRPLGETSVLGNLHWPEETGSAIPEPDLKAGIWFARDVPAMAQVLGTEPVLIVARSEGWASNPLTPLPVDTAGIPNDHLNYAITWFSLAVIWLVMTGAVLWRGAPARKETS